jgi:hypothetical protein
MPPDPTPEGDMTALDPTPPAATPAPGTDEEPGRTGTVTKVVLVTAVLGMALFWIIVYSVAGSYHPPGWLKDRTFPVAAEKLCERYSNRLEAVPLANTAHTSAQRADLVDQVTKILAERRDQLETIVPRGPQARFIEAWLADWKVHLADRNGYARRLRTDPGAEFTETPKESSQMSAVLNKFSDDNEMPSCDTWSDV